MNKLFAFILMVLFFFFFVSFHCGFIISSKLMVVKRATLLVLYLLFFNYICICIERKRANASNARTQCMYVFSWRSLGWKRELPVSKWLFNSFNTINWFPANTLYRTVCVSMSGIQNYCIYKMLIFHLFRSIERNTSISL